jgi:hypothetical protein
MSRRHIAGQAVGYPVREGDDIVGVAQQDIMRALAESTLG